MSKKPASTLNPPDHRVGGFSHSPRPADQQSNLLPEVGDTLTGRCQHLLNLAQKIEAAKAKQPRHIDVWVAALDDEDREALLQAAADPELTNAALQRIMREAGCKVGKDVFNQWRKAHGFPL